MPEDQKSDEQHAKRRRVRPSIRERAVKHRSEPRHPERILWSLLRRSQLGGLKFRRQTVIGPYIVDFCCPAEKLIIEVDGESHVGRGDADAARTAYLESHEYRVLRVTNDDVLHDLEAVGRAILLAAGMNPDGVREVPSHPPPCPLPQREGEALNPDF